jgi:hypothetical protein
MCIMFGKWKMSKFDVVYEPRVEDPVVVATFSTLHKAEAYMAKLKDKKPQTHKFCQIVEKG